MTNTERASLLLLETLGDVERERAYLAEQLDKERETNRHLVNQSDWISDALIGYRDVARRVVKPDGMDSTRIIEKAQAALDREKQLKEKYG